MAVSALPDEAEFVRLTAPFRRELLAHCYRMTGSAHDAEDLVQETYLRAWRGYAGFEGRSSLRFWMYRIATSACLTALEHRGRRSLPSGLRAPTGDPDLPLEVALPDVEWVQPLPDTAFDRTTDDPALIVAAKSTVRLAFVAALQHLPARQRAVLILRDVLAWHADEVAELLDTSVPAVNSALQRARGALGRAALTEEAVEEPVSEQVRTLLDQYVEAFSKADITSLVRLLREDVALEMPPIPTWFSGRDAAAQFLADTVFGETGPIRLLPTWANGVPAFGAYNRDSDGVYRAHAINLVTVTPTGISHMVFFIGDDLFDVFGLPATAGR